MIDSTGHRAVRSWRPRMTIRARLTLTYTALLLTIGSFLVALLYFYMRFVPVYSITSSEDGGSPVAPADSGEPTQFATAEPAMGAGGPGSDGAVVITSAADFLDTILLASIVILVALAALGAWLGWIIAGRVLRPLQRINDAAKRAATGALDHRVGLAGPHDEIRELSDTFDEMLERLEASFHARQRFAANASHELRTPLAATQVMLDVALTDPNLDQQKVVKLAARLRETNRRSVETVEALLDLAEVAETPLRPHSVDLAQTVSEALLEVGAEAEHSRVAIISSLADCVVLANPALLRQLVKNLLENAIRHNHDDGQVTVATQASPDARGRAQLVVSNSGPPVPQDSLAALTEPFYREEGRVSGARAGHGLGLALVSTIVQAHDGSLSLAANPGGGLTVTVELPAAPQG